MKIKYQLVAFVLLIITSTMTSKAQNSDGQRLFLIIGQSNASGRDDNFDPNGLDLPSPDVLLFDDNETFVEATQPLNQFSTVRNNQTQGVNLGLEFGKEINNLVGGQINLVVNARGGTRVAQWRRDNDAGYFNEALARVQAAQEECDCTLEGILWHQGEGNVDSDDGTFTNSYFSSLGNIVMEFREELGNDDIPFIVGQLAPDQFRFEAFNEALTMVSDPASEFEVEDVDWVSSEGLSTIDPLTSTDPDADLTHFNAESVREFGRRYAAVMADFLSPILSVEGVTENAIVNIYPNPAINVINIEAAGQLNDFSSSLYNLDGKLVRNAVNANRISVSDVASGIYLLEITDQQSGQSSVQKVVITK